jgi:exodeoxyribonuclease-5
LGIEFNNQQIYALYDIENWFRKGNDQVYELAGAAGTGKAQPYDTIINTANRGRIQFGDLIIGDCVYNKHYQPVKVVGIYEQGQLLTYKVTFESGKSTECSIQHLWTFVTDIRQNKMETAELSKIINLMDMGFHIYVPMASETDTNKYDRMTEVVPTGEYKRMRCILVDDKEHLYLTNDDIVTHNTTLIKYFIQEIGMNLNDVAFVAFMGKAAMQMGRSGLPAQTLHSLIYSCGKVCKRDDNGNIVVDQKGKPVLHIDFKLKKSLPSNIKLIVLDEGSMVNTKMAEDLLSFGIPVIVLGDLNQLPPVFGKSYFLNNPNYNLTQVMRQKEDDPIVYLAHRVLNHEPLNPGLYGKSAVVPKGSLDYFSLTEADIVLTCTNSLRASINDFFREKLLKIPRLDLPQVGEKVICRKNNWSRNLDNIIYLTNGTAGTLEYVDKESFNGRDIKVDFKPDFTKKKFKNLKLDYKYLYQGRPKDYDDRMPFSRGREWFEFAYAITVHLSQGSQYENVVFLREDKYGWDNETYKKLQYTAITRAMDKITIVI